MTLHLLTGKPVAVTHSKGKGATINPEADFNFEKKQWSARREQGGKKGKKKSPTKAAGKIDKKFQTIENFGSLSNQNKSPRAQRRSPGYKVQIFNKIFKALSLTVAE